MMSSNRTSWWGAAAAAALWLASGATNAALSWNGILSGSVGGVLPATVPTFVWAQPQPFPVLIAGAGALAVAGAVLLLRRLLPVSGDRRVDVVLLWFAVIASGVAVGAAFDIAQIIGALPPARLQWLLNGLGAQAGIGAYWGFIHGWVPALLVVVLGGGQDSTGAARPRDSEPNRRSSAVVTAVTVVALVAMAGGLVVGQRAARTQAVQTEAVAEGFAEESGALPDPYAEGTPVPTTAPVTETPGSDWCTPDQAALLLGSADAATGHRMLSVTLMNFSEGPCVVEGYPDFAFGDQNGNALAVDLERGGSFMTTDPGPQRVEIPAGGSAITRLGWNANPTEGALVARTLFGASYAGETRGSWPVETDIVEGATVAVTAWELLTATDSPTP